MSLCFPKIKPSYQNFTASCSPDIPYSSNAVNTSSSVKPKEVAYFSEVVVTWHAVHPLSYRVVQTLIFHSIMTVYGLVTLIYERESFKLKKIHLELPVIFGMTLWALIGNYVYNGTYGGKDRIYNWFFVVRDPLNVIPTDISPYIEPWLNILAFFTVEILIYLILMGVKKLIKKDVDKASESVIE